MMAETLNQHDEALAQLIAQTVVSVLEQRKAGSVISREKQRWQEYQRIYEGVRDDG